MDTALVLVALGFLVVGIIFFIVWPKIERLQASFDKFRADHMLEHRTVRDKELQRAQAVAATVESLQGIRYAILVVRRPFGRDEDFKVSGVVTHSQGYLPYDDKAMEAHRARAIMPGIDVRHCSSSLAQPNTLLVVYPAHFVPIEELKLPDRRIEVIGGTVPELVPDKAPDLKAVAASLAKS